jgi:hypothetical protein
MEVNINETPMENNEKESSLDIWKKLLQNHHVKMEMENSPEAEVLENFLSSEEGKTALEILKATKQRIDLVHTSSTENQETKYWLSKDGLCSKSHNFSQGNQWEEIEHPATEEMFRDIRYCDKTHSIAERKWSAPDAEMVNWIKQEITKIGKGLEKE